MSSESDIDAVLKKFTEEYKLTIPEKIATLRQILDDMKQKITVDNMKALRFNIHKIAGSAGTYGFGTVSKLCREFEFEIISKIEAMDKIPGDPNWLVSFEQVFEKIKKEFSL
jgi:HPt (histidine-containing phosphotransfer) domain-containing protein